MTGQWRQLPKRWAHGWALKRDGYIADLVRRPDGFWSIVIGAGNGAVLTQCSDTTLSTADARSWAEGLVDGLAAG